MIAINNVVQDKGEFVQAFRENVIQIIGRHRATEDNSLIDEQIEQCQKNIMQLIEISSKDDNPNDNFNDKY